MTRFHIAVVIFLLSCFLCGAGEFQMFPYFIQRHLNYYGMHGLSVFAMAIMVGLLVVKSNPRKTWWLVGWSFFIWAAALMGELLQYFTTTHKVEVQDVLAQTSGSVAAYMIAFWTARGEAKRLKS